MDAAARVTSLVRKGFQRMMGPQLLPAKLCPPPPPSDDSYLAYFRGIEESD